MTFTYQEQTRIYNIEETVQHLSDLFDNAASKSMLNRLLVLAQEEIRRLNSRLDEVESSVSTLIELSKKNQ